MRLCFIDTETTGLNNKIHSIIQLSMIFCDYDVNGLIERSTYNWYIKPYNLAIDKKAIEINGLTDYETFQLGEEVAKELQVILFAQKDKIVISGWNINFDWNFLRSFASFHKINIEEYFTYAPIDVLSAVFCLYSNKMNRPSRFNLEETSKFFKIEPNGKLHNSLTDVKLTLEIFNKITNLKG